MPEGIHAFDLDQAPEDERDDFLGSDDEMEDDEFAFPSESGEEEDDDEVDSAFASDEEDVEMDGEAEGDEDDEMDEDDEDGAIQTNLEDDLDDEGFTLPAVDGVEEEHEHGVSLRDVEARMRWLVRVCSAKDDRIRGVEGK